MKYLKNFFNKYELGKFGVLIGQNVTIKDNDFYLSNIYMFEDNIYLNFDDNKEKYYITKNLEDLSTYMVTIIYEIIEAKKLFDPAYLLGSVDGRIEYIEIFKNILINTKEKIDFNKYIFEGFKYSKNKGKELNTFEFQNILFKYHPEALEIFLDNGFELHKSIIDKYPNIKRDLKKYQLKQDIKKYNL